MRVKELIAELQKHPADMGVYIQNDEDGAQWNISEVQFDSYQNLIVVS